MLDAADAARRRELQRRAYAPGGGLSGAEAAELRELDARASAIVVPPQPVQDPAAGAELPFSEIRHAAVGRGEPGGGDDAPSAPEAVRDQHALDETTRTDGRADGAPVVGGASERTPGRRWLLPLVAGLAILLGLGAGWLVFGRGDGPREMTDAQRKTWTEIEASGEYDPGSVRFVARKHGVDVWQAGKSKGAQDCVVVTRGDERKAQCVASESEGDGFGPQASLEFEQDGDQYMVWAALVADAEGDVVALVQRQNMDVDWDWRSQYNEQELPIAEMLNAAGYSGASLGIVGYDGDTPIWVSESGRTCLMIADSTKVIAEACGELLYDTGRTLELTVGGTSYSLRATTERGNQLTVIRTPGAPATCDPATEQCTSIDDKTGETGAAD